MTHFVTCRLRCPLCGTEFSADEAHGAPLVGRDTDMRPRYEGPTPLLTHIHACPNCRYSGYREAFGVEPSDEDELIEPVDEPLLSLPRPVEIALDDDEVDALRRYVRTGEYTAGLLQEGEEAFGGVRYLLAGRVHEFRHEDDKLGVAHYAMRAAWSARETGDRALERQALKELLLQLSEVLEGEEEPEQAPWLEYLVAETARRAGHFARAIDLFAQVERDADPDEEDGYLLAALARRQTLLAAAQSDVNAVIPPELPGRTHRVGDEDVTLVDDDEDGGPESLN